MSDITQLMNAFEPGDEDATAKMLPLVYDELRRLAAHRLAQEKPGQTLEATALVHEAYLRLVGHGPGNHWEHRGHFFAAAAEAMRRILIETARRKQSVKHGGGRVRVELFDLHALIEAPDELLAMDRALARFASEEPRKAELVKMRFFTGLSMPQAAEALGISLSTAERWWVFSRTWLYTELQFPSLPE